MNHPSSPDADAGLQMPSEMRPLEGLVVGISVSRGEDSAAYGFADEEEVNRAVLRLSDALLAVGARLVFGHDWRPTGVMSAVARLAVTYDVPPENVRTDRSRMCRITNLVPWDRQAELPNDLRQDLEQRGILRIEQLVPERAADLFSALRLPSKSMNVKSIFTGVGLIAVRQRLTEICDARICIGGKYKEYQGFVPGILEEALGSAEQGKSVLLSSLMGGAARIIVGASRAGDWEELTRLPLPASTVDELGDEFVSSLRRRYAEQAPSFLSKDALISRSNLDSEDWDCLTNARDIEVVSALCIKALGKQQAANR